MSSIPPVLPAGQQKNRNMSILILIAGVLAIVLATALLWPPVYLTDSGPARVSDNQTGENNPAAPPAPYVNPELRIQEHFRVAQAAATAGRMLYENPELKILEYDTPAYTVNLYANPELKMLDYSGQSVR